MCVVTCDWCYLLPGLLSTVGVCEREREGAVAVLPVSGGE